MNPVLLRSTVPPLSLIALLGISSDRERPASAAAHQQPTANIYVEEAAPGIYHGTVKLSAANAETTLMEAEVEVQSVDDSAKTVS